MEKSWRCVSFRLAGFCLPLVLAWIGLECWAVRVPNLYSAKRQQLERLTNDVDTLILGSSSAFFDIVPERLPGFAFNLAHVGESLYETDALAAHVVPMLPKLKRVIIQIQYGSLFYRALTDPWRQFCYVQEWGIQPEKVQERLDCRMWSRLAVRTPAFYINFLIKSLRGLIRDGNFVCHPSETFNIDSIDNRGWWHPRQEGSGAPDLSPAAAKFRLAAHHLDLRYEFEAQNIVYLDHLVSLFRQRNIEVVLVTVPVSQSYKAGMRPDYWNETQRVITQRTNNESVYYYSFLNVPQLEPKDYLDVDHLSTVGALHFTPLLVSALNQEKYRPSGRANLKSTAMAK
jgi:hypothetical protein